jgi:Uncharacterized conserved protein
MAIHKQTKEAIQKYLIKGLVWSIPALLCLWLLSFVFGIADKIMGSVTSALLKGLLPESWLVGPIANGNSPVLSFILLLLVMTVIGALVSWKFGENIVRSVEGLVMKLPGIGMIYRNTRKMTEFFDGEKGTPFERVVMIPYPHAGIYTLAFVAGKIDFEYQGGPTVPCIKAVVPNPPTGVQGIVLVPERDVIEVPMSVEEGIQFYVSVGMVSPTRLSVQGQPPTA